MPVKLHYNHIGDRRLCEAADWFGAFRGLPLHFHDEVQVSFLSAGERDYVIDGMVINLRVGQVLIVPPSTVHRALPSFNPALRSTEFYLPPTALPVDAREWIGRRSYFIVDAAWLRGMAQDDVPGALFDIVSALGASCRKTEASSRSPSGRPYSMALLRSGATIAQIAAAQSMSREAYIRAFARQFGMTPHAYRVNLRLNEGRALLRDRHAIADVAAGVGFSDQSHFGRFFQSWFGSTPGQFRSAHT